MPDIDIEKYNYEPHITLGTIDNKEEIALAIELFVNGSLNTFAKQTNVDTNNRLICYDILDLGKQLLPIGMLVVLDSILNRITMNRAKGRNTFIFIDEIYLLFQHEYSANFLFTLWKRVRKYGAYCTGITQNVEDMLQSHTARIMLANSELIVMLNQAATDRIELAKLLNISDLQMSYITNVNVGEGLIKIGSSLIPFVNKFPRNTNLYKLMTTKPGDIIFFDWEDSNDGKADHVGIIEKTENGRVYTIEGNSTGDMCKQKDYSIDSSVILGYGTPMY